MCWVLNRTGGVIAKVPIPCGDVHAIRSNTHTIELRSISQATCKVFGKAGYWSRFYQYRQCNLQSVTTTFHIRMFDIYRDIKCSGLCKAVASGQYKVVVPLSVRKCRINRCRVIFHYIYVRCQGWSLAQSPGKHHRLNIHTNAELKWRIYAGIIRLRTGGQGIIDSRATIEVTHERTCIVSITFYTTQTIGNSGKGRITFHNYLRVRSWRPAFNGY